MATLMQWGNSEGIKGRCDAKCHNAKEPKCECMCGGRFHGKANQAGGLEKAVKEFWEEVVERAKERAEQEGVKLEIFGLQLGLFNSNLGRTERSNKPSERERRAKCYRGLNFEGGSEHGRRCASG